MTQWIYIDLAAFLIVVMLAGVIIPQILLIAFRKNLFDDVDPRKIHKGAVPRLGGIAFFPAILFTVMLIFGIGCRYAPYMLEHVRQSSITSLCFITCSVVIVYLVGMADDLIGIKYRAKFVAQLICAALIISGGIMIDNLHGFLGIHEMPLVGAVCLTAILMVFITNAINLIDGIDGLASGLSAIACAFFGIIFFRAGLMIYSMFAFATLGALVPFFYYNVFGNAKKRKKIFMGDTGALTIGLLLSTFSLRITQIPDSALNLNPAVVAFAPLLIPGLDVVRVYLHRLKAHRNPFLPDKSHIHHKLLALGMPQRVAMPTIVAASVVLTGFNYLLCNHIHITLLFALDLVIWIVANIALSRAIGRRQRRTGEIYYN